MQPLEQIVIAENEIHFHIVSILGALTSCLRNALFQELCESKANVARPIKIILMITYLFDAFHILCFEFDFNIEVMTVHILLLSNSFYFKKNSMGELPRKKLAQSTNGSKTLATLQSTHTAKILNKLNVAHRSTSVFISTFCDITFFVWCLFFPSLF